MPQKVVDSTSIFIIIRVPLNELPFALAQALDAYRDPGLEVVTDATKLLRCFSWSLDFSNAVVAKITQSSHLEFSFLKNSYTQLYDQLIKEMYKSGIVHFPILAKWVDLRFACFLPCLNCLFCLE